MALSLTLFGKLALLILAEDPFLENRSLAQEVLDYILLKLNEHQELGEVVTQMEQYLVRRSANSSHTSKNGTNSARLPTPRRPTS